MRLLILVLILALSSCVSDVPKDSSPGIDHSSLIGYWNIDSASRNGKETHTLDNAYIHFSKKNELSTNIFGSEVSQILIWNDSTAIVSDSSMSYAVHSLTADTLSLSFSLQRHNFNLLFLKGESERPARQ